MIIYQRIVKRFASAILLVSITACADAGSEPEMAKFVSQHVDDLVLDVYKRPSCGCCDRWIMNMEESGFQTTTHSQNSINELKSAKGIQARYQSCHTAVSSNGYVFEGHIPARYIQEFLAQPPEGALGLAVPGMPVGTPGMEIGGKFSPYTVLLLSVDGGVKSFAQVHSQGEQF